MAGENLFGGQNWYPASHLLGEAEQPTDAKSLMAPYMGDPRQMLQFLMDPQNQQHMAQFGVHFNPQTIRESPFFSQSFMQQHPQLGGRLSGLLSGIAATPEAPMVSGAGSGISRAIQGGMGGPEGIRNFQRQQLQGPMQQMGMQIPPMEFQRKEQLEQGMVKMMGDTTQERNQALDLARKAEQDKTANDQAKLESQQRMQQTKSDMLNPKAPQPGLSAEGKPGAWINTPPQLGQTANPREYSEPLMGSMFGTSSGQGLPISEPDKPGSWAFQEGASEGRPLAPRGNAPADRAGAAYQKRLGDYEGWISKVQGNLVPVMGQEGSQQQPARYWKDLNPQEQQQFMQQQQQLKQQWDNEYHQQAGGQPYNYQQQQPMMAPRNAGQSPVATGRSEQGPQGNFNQPPQDLMNPGYGQQQQLDPRYQQSLQQFGY